MKNMKLDANGTEIRIIGDVVNEEAYISLTDIAKYKNPDNAFIVVSNWIISIYIDVSAMNKNNKCDILLNYYLYCKICHSTSGLMRDNFSLLNVCWN